jgi:hypothetical protein
MDEENPKPPSRGHTFTLNAIKEGVEATEEGQLFLRKFLIYGFLFLVVLLLTIFALTIASIYITEVPTDNNEGLTTRSGTKILLNYRIELEELDNTVAECEKLLADLRSGGANLLLNYHPLGDYNYPNDTESSDLLDPDNILDENELGSFWRIREIFHPISGIQHNRDCTHVLLESGVLHLHLYEQNEETIVMLFEDGVRVILYNWSVLISSSSLVVRW